MFKELTIDHFRGIQKLDINDLGRVNLIVGKNGSGKSSLLDSFFLITNPLNTKLITSTNIFRGYNRIDENFFSTYFYGLNDEYNIHFHASLKDGSERNLTIRPKFNSEEFEEYSEDIEFSDIAEGLNRDSTQEHSHIPGVSLEYDNPKFKDILKSTIELGNEKLKVNQPDDLKEEFKGVYLSVHNFYKGWADRLEKVIVDKKIKYVIEALDIIDDSLEDITLGNQGMIYCDIGYKRLLPLNIMGDGFQRLLAILLAMYEARNGIVLIDEIENGIFYSKFPDLWKAIYNAALKFNVQIFATTHSIECIEHFSRASLDSELFQSDEDLKLYRIEEKKERHKVTDYDKDLLKTSLEQGFEIR